MFPQAIGVAATFRPEHNQAIADAIRRQMRAIGAHQGLSPVLDICRDPRWGRLEETYGEDPFLVGADGRGLRPRAAGRRPRRRGSSPPPSTSSATARRRAASTGRRPTCPSASSATCTCARSRRRCATPAWLSVMNGYHELDGVAVRRQPLVAHRSAARRVGLRRHRRVGLLRGAPARRVPPRRRPTAPVPRRPRCTPGSTSSCPAPTATPSRCATRWRRGAIDDRRRRRGGAARARRRSSASVCSSSRTSTTAGWRSTPAPPAQTRPRPAGRARQPRAAQERRRAPAGGDAVRSP